MNDGDKLLLSTRILGEPQDMMESPYAFDIRDGVLLLYAEPAEGQAMGLPYAGYNLDLIEHFEVVPAHQVKDLEHKLAGRDSDGVNLDDLDPKDSPFRGGRLKFKGDSA